MDAIPAEVWHTAHTLIARNTTNSTSTTTSSTTSRPPIYKAIGLTLAIASGLFIGTSFVLKKTGLLRANAKYNEEAGEGYGYLKNAFWWSGMTLMIVGEICNFVAYAFVDAILVTPLGALSVVVTTILSAIFLKERLSFVGKVGCFNCIIGSVVIVMNAPAQSAVADIQEMKKFVLAPGFLSYAGVIVLGCAFIALWVAPRYGKKTMLVYLSICSLIGGLSVVATQGLGSAVVAQAGGKPQFNQWFLYLLLFFVITTLVTEIIYLNKALNLFNAALVTPTYYVFFTSATIVTSAILFQGFKGTAITIATVIMGFLVICSGVVLLQMSKSAKDVPDAAIFKGDLDQVREMAEVEQPETEPKADAIRGTAALIRRISVSRQKMEQEEARRLREDKLRDQLEPLGENEIVEWDGLRRRKTIVGDRGSGTPVRRRTIHPPLGMSRFPDPEDEGNDNDERDRSSSGFFESLRTRAHSVLPHPPRHANTDPLDGDSLRSPSDPVALTDIKFYSSKPDSPIVPYGPGSLEEAEAHIYGLPKGLRKEPGTSSMPSPRSKPLPAKPPASPSMRPIQPARRQFSFTNFIHRGSKTPADIDQPPTRPGLSSRGSSIAHTKQAMKNATEEERLGLVKGDSSFALPTSQSPEQTRQPMLPKSLSQSSSLASLDDPTQYPNPHRPTSMSDSDEDDGWQMAPPTDQDSRPTTPAPRAIPLHQPSSTTTQTPPRPTSSRRRPSPPSVYRPPPSTSLNQNFPPSHQTTSSTNTNRAEPIPDRATPAATSSGRFPNSSTSQAPLSRLLTADQESGREPPPTVRGAGTVRIDEVPQLEDEQAEDTQQFGSAMNRTTSPKDYDTSRRRFEEQSRREREERKRRAAAGGARRQSWKGGPAQGDAGESGSGGGGAPGGAQYI